jgi:hypothetical protein
MIGHKQATNNQMLEVNETETTTETRIVSTVLPSYSQIMRTVLAMIHYHGGTCKNKSSIDCFTDLIGCKVLEGRSNYLYDLKNLNINHEKRKWKNAIMLANALERKKWEDVVTPINNQAFPSI